MKHWIAALALLCAAIPTSAQARPSGTGTTRSAAVYVLFTNGWPNYGHETIQGGTIGGYRQWSRFAGIDARVTDLPMGGQGVHQGFIGAGPRVQTNRGKFQIFGNVDAGLGHAQYTAGWQPDGGYHWAGAQSSFAYFLTGGVDYRLMRKLSVRLGQFDYGSMQVLDSGLNPKMVSAGIVFKLF